MRKVSDLGLAIAMGLIYGAICSDPKVGAVVFLMTVFYTSLEKKIDDIKNKKSD